MTDRIDFTLEKPVFHGGKFIRKLSMRRPTQADIDLACATSEEAGVRGLALVAIVSGVKPKALAKMTEADHVRIGEVFATLTGDVA